jgi:hypothetical protein
MPPFKKARDDGCQQSRSLVSASTAAHSPQQSPPLPPSHAAAGSRTTHRPIETPSPHAPDHCGLDGSISRGLKAQAQAQPRTPVKVISELFQGTAETVTQCMVCENANRRAESFLDVSLPVQLGRSLSWSLANHGKDEIMEGSNKYACGVCNTYQEARQCWRIAKVPPLFTVHLKLFAYACGRALGAKVPAAMPCPFTLRLTNWCTTSCKERDMTYRLSSVIVHDGSSASSGHYYTYIDVPGAGWHSFDDGDVMQSSEDELRRSLFTSLTSRTTAYLLFYKREDDMPRRRDGDTMEDAVPTGLGKRCAEYNGMSGGAVTSDKKGPGVRPVQMADSDSKRNPASKGEESMGTGAEKRELDCKAKDCSSEMP